MVSEIQREVDRRIRHGEFNDPRIVAAECHNWDKLQDEPEYQLLLLKGMLASSLVDINDFPICESRANFVGLMAKGIKRLAWKFLKFYTYRMWSQQNRINSQHSAAMLLLAESSRREIELLQNRIDRLEKRLEER